MIGIQTFWGGDFPRGEFIVGKEISGGELPRRNSTLGEVAIIPIRNSFHLFYFLFADSIYTGRFSGGTFSTGSEFSGGFSPGGSFQWEKFSMSEFSTGIPEKNIYRGRISGMI